MPGLGKYRDCDDLFDAPKRELTVKTRVLLVGDCLGFNWFTATDGIKIPLLSDVTAGGLTTSRLFSPKPAASTPTGASSVRSCGTREILTEP